MLTPTTLSTVLAEAGGDLSRLHPRAVEVFHDGYLSGHHDGYRAGYVARAEDEAREWQAVARSTAHLALELYGLEARRNTPVNIDTRTPAQLVADAYKSWGIELPAGGGRHVA